MTVRNAGMTPNNSKTTTNNNNNNITNTTTTNNNNILLIIIFVVVMSSVHLCLTVKNTKHKSDVLALKCNNARKTYPLV